MPVPDIRVSRWRQDWFWALLLIAFVFIAYAQVFRAGFIWDDESHLTQNPCVDRAARLEGNLDHDASSLLSASSDDVLGAAQVCRPKSAAIPRSNVLFHAVSAILLWRVLQTTSSPRRVARRCTLGFAPGNGAIRRVGY